MYRVEIKTNSISKLTDVLRAIQDFEGDEGVTISLEMTPDQQLLLPAPKPELAPIVVEQPQYVAPRIVFPAKWIFRDYNGGRRSRANIDQDLYDHLPDAIISVPDLVNQLRDHYKQHPDFYIEKTVMNSLERLMAETTVLKVRQDGPTLFIRKAPRAPSTR